MIYVTYRHQQGGKKHKIIKTHPFSNVLDDVLEGGSKICLSAYKTYKQGVDATRRGWGRGMQLLTHHFLTGPPPASSHVKRRPACFQVQMDTGEAGRQEIQGDTYTALPLCRAAGFLRLLVSGE